MNTNKMSIKTVKGFKSILLIGLLRKLNRMKDGDDPTLLGSTL